MKTHLHANDSVDEEDHGNKEGYVWQGLMDTQSNTYLTLGILCKSNMLYFPDVLHNILQY